MPHDAFYTHGPDMIIAIIGMAFWFLFPIGMFLSMSHVDKNTDQIILLDHLRHHSSVDVKGARFVKTKKRFHLPLTEDEWLHHA